MRIDCPICGGELPVAAHRPHTAWTPREIALARRLLSSGMSFEGAGRLLGVSGTALRCVLRPERRKASGRAA